jgi:carboxyl-terminal processing protease
MQHRFYHLWIIILTIFLLSLGGVDRPFGGACQMGSILSPSGTIPRDAEPDFRLIAEAWNEIQRSYVGKKSADPQAMTYGAISGMVDSLGDTEHSRFLTPEMVRQEKNLTRGKFEGIGAEVQKKNNQIIIVTPMDGSPAQKAGLKPGDVILKVDGEEVAGQPLEHAVSRILGPAGTKVRLTVQSPRTGERKEVTLIREKISLRNVVWQRLPGTQIAHLRIASFSVGVGKNLKKALKAIKREGIRGLILDLRNNPGGLFGEAIEVASQFMDQGTVVLERNAEGKIKPISVESGALAPTLPLVVLVNGGSASAAEIVAGALQDSQRAKLVGEKTFGTGTVLENFPLSDGSALLLATMEWLTPAGRTIWHRGIFPDIILPLPPDVNPLFPDGEENMTETDLQSSGDAQILKALTLLLP